MPVTLSDLIKQIEQGTKRRIALMKGKNADYAQKKDALLNFRQISQICHILDIDPRRSKEDVVLFFVVHKLQRLCNLRGRKAQNEARRDTVDDLHNYIDLADAAEEDK